jgi:hypothetical protein
MSVAVKQMSKALPGFNLSRVARQMQSAVARLQLNLKGLHIFTEAATGAYVVTPVLAALAGAERVYAISRTTRFGTFEEVTAETKALARLVGVEDRIEIVNQKSKDIVSRCDIVTNSGHVRPLDKEFISWMKPSAVITFMYEAWELRPEDVDVPACRERGIALAATHERHEGIDVFSFLPMMAAKQLVEAGVSVYKSNLLLLCDNEFAPYMAQGLKNMGAAVDVIANFNTIPTGADYDAIIVSATPKSIPVMTRKDAEMLARRWPGIVVTQFFGDVDRNGIEAAGLACWPATEPPLGHMGILPSEIGPESIIRLQSGGLKVGEVLARGLKNASASDREYIQQI